MANTADDIAAEQKARAERALASLPDEVAQLICRAPSGHALALAVDDLAQANSRERIQYSGGELVGLVRATWLCAPGDQPGRWSYDEFSTLRDHAALLVSTALLSLGED